ncbi:hypothetical protein DFQ01_1259 [Paenibacillus cellulosilyticus]|uniref:Carboxypeptidase family protein n=1 Tax=Paenibacillus cellulosilyticus TaxID=375489 RepID=A0A2V2YMH1_9BACL|nr:hypothetical protein [Paenibacillus cellulosilyticus]PWV95666.1 hypothetical protein DFQ01_1259 [Paenibacillus cellulosilyticus]QKS47699.1 hypothetical protein HUB94_25395 [Paenibacillus cellulosilyticus]
MTNNQEQAFAVPPEAWSTRVSAAIKLSDSTTVGKPPIGAVRLQLSPTGPERAPIRNLSGWYVYTDLPKGVYNVVVVSDYYLDAEISFVVDSAIETTPTIEVALLPNSSYPFPSDMTRIRGAVRLPATAAAADVSDAAVRAVLFESEAGLLATLAEDTTTGGTKLKLGGLTAGSVTAGTIVLLKDPRANRLEYARITAPLPANPSAEGYTTAEPLRYPHAAGTYVYAMKEAVTVQSKADNRGEFVLPLVRMPLHRGFVVLTITLAGFRTVYRDIQCDEGSESSPGIITLLSI